MNCTRTRSWFSSFLDWLHELSCEQDRKSERQRLAQLSSHNHAIEAQQVMSEPGTNVRRKTPSDLDSDNYLRGQLLDVEHDVAEKHNRQTVSQWLHPEAHEENKIVEATEETRLPQPRTTGELDYLINQTRLLEFTDIGMGLDRDCLSSFIDQDLAPGKRRQPRTTREFMLMAKTVQDVPAFGRETSKKLSFQPLENKNNHQVG